MTRRLTCCAEASCRFEPPAAAAAAYSSLQPTVAASRCFCITTVLSTYILNNLDVAMSDPRGGVAVLTACAYTPACICCCLATQAPSNPPFLPLGGNVNSVSNFPAGWYYISARVGGGGWTRYTQFKLSSRPSQQPSSCCEHSYFVKRGTQCFVTCTQLQHTVARAREFPKRQKCFACTARALAGAAAARFVCFTD